MSLLKRLEEEAEFLLEELKIRAAHYKRANGHVPDLIAEMIGHLENQIESTSVVETPAPVVDAPVAHEPVAIEAPVIDTIVVATPTSEPVTDTPVADK